MLAIVFVASPFYMRQGMRLSPPSTGRCSTRRERSARGRRARSGGCAAARPGGLAAGSSLAFALGLGEFGATIIFAGSFAGVTRTAPLAIYAELDRSFESALALGALLIVVSVVVLVAVKALTSWTFFGWTSPSPSAPSTSS